MVRGTTYHLGFFTDPTDAAHAYDAAGKGVCVFVRM